MFRKWLNENDINKFNFSHPLFPKASDRTFWKQKYDEKEVKKAEKLIGCDWPLVRATHFITYEKTGNRQAQELPYFERRQNLLTLVVGEIMEHKGRFLPDIVDGIWVICEETYWGGSAHKASYGHKSTHLPNVKDPYIDLFAGETAASLAIIYYILYDELQDFCPDVLTRIEYEIEHKVITPYLMHTDWWWMGYHGWANNWCSWILSNILTVLLIMPISKRIKYEGIAKSLFEIQTFYDSTPDDGGCEEGAMYWALAGATLFEFVEQLYLATDGKINFFGDEKMKNIAEYECKAYIGNGYFANFADGAPKVNTGLGYILYMFGKRINDENVMAFSKELGDADNTRNFRLRRKLYNAIYKADIENLPTFIPESSSILPILQNSFVRCGKWYYAAKGNHNDEPHNHNDVGSFLVYYDNKPILCDPSCGTYTKETFLPSTRYKIWTMQSGWHNLPVINETEQKNGKEFNASSFSLDDKKTRVDFENAYPEDAGLEKLSRVINVTDLGIDLSDTFRFKNRENSIFETFICVLEPKIAANKVIIGNEFVIEANLSCEIVIDSVDFCGDKKLINMWNSDKMNRIRFKFNAKESAEIKFTLRKCSQIEPMFMLK